MSGKPASIPIEFSGPHAKQLTATTSEAPLEYPAHARVGGAARCRLGFPVSRPSGRVDVSISGHGEGANLQRGQCDVRTDPCTASILGDENAGIGRSSDDAA